MTIESAARSAAVGSETWRRWEAGGAVRADKLQGLLKVLRLPSLDHLAEESDEVAGVDIKDDLAKLPASIRDLGELAVVFMVGLDLLVDGLDQDMEELAGMPRGSHLGQLHVSMIGDYLPDRWLTRYDHEFCWRLKSALHGMRQRIQALPEPRIARTPADDLIVRAALREGVMYFEVMERPFPWAMQDDDDDDADDSPDLLDDLLADWLDDAEGILLDGRDSPFVFFLVTHDPQPGDPLHFESWFKSWETPGRSMHLLRPHLSPADAEAAHFRALDEWLGTGDGSTADD